MEIKELYYFKVVVEEGSILKASVKLHISQPPLSRMMKSLEEKLNTTLFTRGKKLTLTPSGRLLYDKAISILELHNDTLLELEAIENGYDTTLQLGIVSSSTSLLYTHAIKDFNQLYPHIKFNIKEANTYQLLELLKKHIIDAAIVRTPFDSTGYNSVFFKSEEMIILSKNLNFSKACKIIDLDNKPLIIYRRFKEILQELFKNNHIKLNIICELDDAKSAILFASTGIGYAIVPKSAYNLFSFLNLSICNLEEDSLNTSLGIIYRKNEELIPAYKEFIKILKNN